MRHQLDPVAGIEGHEQSQAALPSRPGLDALDVIVMNDPARVADIAAASEVVDLRNDLPESVPSGLPLAE